MSKALRGICKAGGTLQKDRPGQSLQGVESVNYSGAMDPCSHSGVWICAVTPGCGSVQSLWGRGYVQSLWGRGFMQTLQGVDLGSYSRVWICAVTPGCGSRQSFQGHGLRHGQDGWMCFQGLCSSANSTTRKTLLLCRTALPAQQGLESSSCFSTAEQRARVSSRRSHTGDIII